jgi:hypothetical protein
MTVKTPSPTVDVKSIVGNQAITDIVNAARSLWQEGQKNRLSLGQQFSKLRAEVEKYQRNNKGLSYRQAVAQTAVPWSTAERYREMYEVVNEYKIPEDTFLVLCEEGANIAEIKGALKEAFKGAISTVIPRIASLDVTNSKEVADLADDLNQLIPASMVTADLETLNGELAELLAELPQKQSAEQSADIAEAIHQKRTEIGESYAKPMKALVSALAPFVNWSPQQVKDYMTAFADQPLSQQTRLYNEATSLAKSVATGIAIGKKAGT